MDQALSPAESYNTMTSEDSDKMEEEDNSFTSVRRDRADSYSSCYSIDSDDCEKKTRKVKTKEDVSESSDTHTINENINENRHPSLTVAFTFKAISKTLGQLSEFELKAFKRMLWKYYPQSFSTPPQGTDIVDLVDRLLECYTLEVSLHITKTHLAEMGKNKLVDHLDTLCLRNEVRYDLAESLRKIYGEVCEDFGGEKRSFDDVYTTLNITSTCDNGPNIEHEVLKIEKLNSNQEHPKQLSTADLLTPSFLESSSRFILLTGLAGSGKSMAVRKLVLDWIEERAHQHVNFMFPLPFRELKQFEGSRLSLADIIKKLYPATEKLRDEDYRCDECQMMFVFDGLDEYNWKIDFENTELLSDPTDPSTLKVIVVNLMRARLLYRGLFLVTTRPYVRACVPWDAHYDEIEVLGFCDPQREEYFKKRFKDPNQASRVVEYVNSIKTLRIMCHLPLFCSIVADECQRIFKENGTQAELPKSITYMYTKLLLALLRQHRRLRAPDISPDKERDFLIKLGKLAFTMLEQGRFQISQMDWKENDISDQEAVPYTGLCTQYVIKPYVLFHENVLSFIHPTMQEYLAALYALLTFTNHGKNVFEEKLKNKVKGIFKGHSGSELYKEAVDRSLHCENGRLDIFLRFLFGMAHKTNQELLQPFFTSSLKWPTSTEDAAALIRKKMRDCQNPDRNINLQRCLAELGLRSLGSLSSLSDC